MTGSRVFHVRVRFDINGFYLEGNKAGGRVTTVEDVLNLLVQQRHPLGTPLPAAQFVTARIKLAAVIRTFPCFYGRIGSAKAAELLAAHRTGTFIIRDSSREGAFATSYKTDAGVRHSLVLVDDQGLSTPGDNRFYPSLDDFIDASRSMYFGLPRSSAAMDDNLLESLGIREAHVEELARGLSVAGNRWRD